MKANRMFKCYDCVYYLQQNPAAWQEIDLILMIKPVLLGEECSELGDQIDYLMS